MHTVRHELLHTRYATFVLVITPVERKLSSYKLAYVTRYGRTQVTYVDAESGLEIFENCYFDDAGEFEHGYAPVVKNGRYYHIDTRGKVAYPWRFSDMGPMNDTGVVAVQHPRAHGWSHFHVASKTFINNPPRYKN